MGIDEMRSEKEAGALKQSAMTKYALAALQIALQVLKSAADAGNVQCKAGLKEIFKLKKP